MTTQPKEPSQLVAGMSHREMLDIMAANNIFCGHDKFARILQDAQRRAIDHAKREAALDRVAADAEELNLYEDVNKEQA